MNPVRPAGSARRRSLDSNMPINSTNTTSSSGSTNSNSGSSSGATAGGSSEAIKVLCRFRKPMAVIKANKASGSSSNSTSSSSNNFFGNSSTSTSYNEEPSETGELMVNDCYSLDLNTNSVAAAIDEVERRRFTFDKVSYSSFFLFFFSTLIL